MSPQPQEPDSEAPAWHLDRKIGLAHIFSTIAAIASLVILGSQFHTRLSLVEQAVVVQHGSEARQDTDVAEFKREMRETLLAINAKLDRLIERGK